MCIRILVKFIVIANCVVVVADRDDDDNDDDDNDDDDGGGLSDRAIVGIVVGITVPLVLISIFVGIYIQRRRKSRGRYTPKKISMKKVSGMYII